MSAGAIRLERVLLMAMTTFKSLAIPTAAQFVSVARGIIGTREKQAPDVCEPVGAIDSPQDALRGRPEYQRFLDQELGRQTCDMSTVEDDERAMLDSMRSALYADD